MADTTQDDAISFFGNYIRRKLKYHTPIVDDNARERLQRSAIILDQINQINQLPINYMMPLRFRLSDFVEFVQNPLNLSEDVELPLRNDALELLPVKKFFEIYECKCDKCTICQDDFTSHVDVRVLPCEHLFHVKCIDEWFQHHHVCPLCRASCGAHVATIQ